MQSLDRRLVEVVERLLEEHGFLLRECQRQRDALVAGDTKKLDAVVAMLAKRVESIQQCEAERIQISKQLAEQHGVDVEHITVTFLEDKMSQQEFHRLRKSSEQLANVIINLKNTHEENTKLLQQSLHFTRKTVEIVANFLDSGNYGTSKQRGSGGHLFDVQA